ncbi:MAG: bifunctional nuclease family protein [Acidobacteriota bacterium]|nr:MAG: bifunctional nuclease family protein [Acidobacteriota bacterium]
MQVEMRIQGLMCDPITRMPIVLLRDPKSDAKLPIWVGVFEASAISLELEHVQPPRPMTHDLFRETLRRLGARLARVVITGLQDSTFFAELELETASGTLRIDARPSDAIALALRCEAPIFAEQQVIEDAQNIDLTQGHEDSERYRAWLEELDRKDLGKYEM